jgi:hypothetical protein
MDMSEKNHTDVIKLIDDLTNATSRNDSTKLWNRVTKIVSHDFCYTKEDIEKVKKVAKTSLGLTHKQISKIDSIKSCANDYDSDDYHDDDYVNPLDCSTGEEYIYRLSK